MEWLFQYWDYSSVEIKSLFHYKFTFILLFFRFGHIYFSRNRYEFTKGKFQRSSTDATWFLPAYFWGIESVFHIFSWRYSMGVQARYEWRGFLEHSFFSLLILFVVIGLCFLQEYLARHTGIGVRKIQATIPLPVMASIVSVLVIWAFNYVDIIVLSFISPM